MSDKEEENKHAKITKEENNSKEEKQITTNNQIAWREVRTKE